MHVVIRYIWKKGIQEGFLEELTLKLKVKGQVRVSQVLKGWKGWPHQRELYAKPGIDIYKHHHDLILSG